MNKEKYLEFDINYFQDEDGIFTALIPQIKGCIASGKTMEEAYNNAIESIDSCLEARNIIINTLMNIKSKNIKFNTYKTKLYA
ncbi:MAG: type II toxin-antitoxin system HicB family antitoxin [Candidatus Gracilibacteria bacterium]